MLNHLFMASNGFMSRYGIITGRVKDKKTGKEGFVSGIVSFISYEEGSHTKIESVRHEYFVVWDGDNEPSQYNSEDFISLD